MVGRWSVGGQLLGGWLVVSRWSVDMTVQITNSKKRLMYFALVLKNLSLKVYLDLFLS